MNTQHTPGPWSVELDHATNAPEFIRTHIDGEMHDIASMLCDETGNASANARLISSAPDLLGVLRDVREAWLAGRMGDVEGILTGDVCTDAIAKATGGVL